MNNTTSQLNSSQNSKSELISIIRSLLKVNVGEEMISYKEFQEFILSERINFLKISFLPNSNKVVLTNNDNMKPINEKEICLTFHKTRNKSIQIETFLDDVDIICSRGSITKTMLNEIDNNLIPKISNIKSISKESSSINSMLGITDSFKDKIINLEKKLNFDKIVEGKISEDNFEGVFTVYDEIDFWRAASKITKDQERNGKILNSILKLEKYYLENYYITNETINEVLMQIVGFAEDILQDVSIIPKINTERLKNFLEMSSDFVACKLAAFLTSLNFTENNSALISKLNEISKTISSAFDRIEYINKLFYGKRSKINGIDSDSQLNKLFSVVNDLLDIKSLYFEISKLMPEMNLTLKFNFNNSSNNNNSTNMNKTNTSLISNNTLNNNNNTNAIFSSAKQLEEIKITINNDLEKYENDIIIRLNEEIFSNLSTNSSSSGSGQVIAILREMNNWKSILSRPKILKLTQQSREILFKDFRDYFTQIKANFESKNQESIEETIESFEKINNMSPKISEILWAHTVKQKIENCRKLSVYFKDLETYEKMLDLLDNFISLIVNFINENINDWQNEFLDFSSNNKSGVLKDLIPKVGSDLIEIHQKTGFLNVNFSEKLFKLIQDMRILSEYGYVNKINKEIHKVYEEGKKILKDAISLKQIANFYNTLSSQVISSQKPMLVQCARDFETSLFLLTERTKLNKQKAMANDSNKLSSISNANTLLDLENFVGLVQTAANDLTKEIRKLKKAHSTILDYLTQLLNYDLITNKNKWKEILKKSRNVFFETVESYKGENESLTKEWAAHWNFQLYKVLKIQYTVSLEKYFDYVSELICEFKVQNNTLIINPPIEDLKKNLYKELKSFISIPVLIKGFTDDADYYNSLINTNTNNIKLLYLKANEALEKIEILKNDFSEILGLCSVDFETYIQNNFTKLDDWRFNYEILKKKKKELELREDYVKLDCFKVNLIPLKSFMDEVFDKIFDLLAYTLKEKLASSMKVVDEFVKDAIDKMEKKSTNMQEILIFKKNFMELSKKKFEIKKICEEGEKMNELLTKISGQTFNVNLQISNLESKMESLDNIMNSFSDMIEEQKQNVKIELNSKIKNINVDLEKFYSKWTAIKIPDNYTFISENDNLEFEETAKSIQNIYEEWANYEKEILNMMEECKNFEIEIPEIKNFEKIKGEIDQNKSKWSLLFSFNIELENIYKEDWLSIRFKAYGIIQDYQMNWTDKIKKREKDFIYYYIFNKLEKFKQSLNVYKYLIGDNFERDHWKSLFNMLKFDNKITKENLKFGNFIEKTELLIKKAADIKDLYSRAQGEILIRNAMSELSAWFETAEFTFTEYVNVNNNRKTPLIKDWKEILNEISEKQALLISVKSSEYFSRFSDQIEQYENKFSNLDIWLQNLNLIQRKWVYLEPIFLRGSLPKESARFKKIDDEFRNILITINSNSKVQTIFSIMNIKDTLEMLIDQLEKCQKALNDFLEEKRNKFARLFFLGDDDLLEFLAKSKDQAVIKNNLKKLYQGISTLAIDDQKNNTDSKIFKIISSIGEKVDLNNKILIVDELEKWLSDLTNEMKNTLSLNLSEAMKNYSYGSKDVLKNFENLNNFSAQICNMSEMIGFTVIVENAIKNNKLYEVKKLMSELIEKLSIIQAQTTSNNSSDKINDHQQSSQVKLFKIKNLMLDFIHNMEIVDNLIKEKVEEIEDWTWFSQLKYYYLSNNENSKNNSNSQKQLKISMCDGSFDYTFEYQGASQKLVHTPLTDKCYLTLTQALRLGYGGNPYGPAGTGKTESVKALGQAFGRQVLVFNCDEGIDFKAMGRIFIGLVKSGAWGCFDEFNRLLEEQLSAISTQIQIIQFALKQNLNTLTLLSQKINVDGNSAIFVTLNPAGKGYGGRSKLPDNLKILFRPVAMSVPDNLQIAQTLLYAEGFKFADILARKLTSLFSLCKQSLSNQQHYDWGLRSLKTILTVANQQIQILLTENQSNSKEIKNNNGKISYEEEVDILIKAIRINVLSKLTFEDAKILNLLIQDVFPGIQMKDIVYEDLNKVLLDVYEESKLELIESQFKKVIQFHEACKQRMGIVLVGPGGCGKSTIWKLLKNAYLKLNQQVKIQIINPKSISRSLLLGYMNHDTGEYTYGVLTKCAREVEKENPETKCWIICDGDIDPEWIEALNSVLDDNRLLTMQNGERINFGSNVNFIFESDSLKFASPATISRMGIIYMNKEDLDIKSLINSWIRKSFCNGDLNGNTNLKNNLENWFENYFYEIYANYFEKSSSVSGFGLNEDFNMLKTTNYGIIQNFLSLCLSDSFIKNTDSNSNNKNEGVKVNNNTGNIDFIQSKSHFVNILIKGLGANLNSENRKKLATEIYQICGEKPPNMNNPLNNFLDKKSNSIKEYEFKHEIIDIKNFNSQKFNPLIKTPTVLNYLEVINKWLEANEPFIIIGPEGSGKNLLINNAVSQLKSCNISVINCTSQTTSTNIIQKLQQICTYSNTSKGRALRPKDCQKIILFLKDINLPKPDKYNTIQLISFLHQIVSYQGFYDDNLEFIHLERIQIIASMNPSSTLGRYEITTRLTGNVRILYVDYPSNEELYSIYENYLNSVIYNYKENITPIEISGNEKDQNSSGLNNLGNSVIKKLSSSIVEFYLEIKSIYKLDEQRHYIFTPRDLTTFITNLIRYEVKDNTTLIEVLGYELIRVFKDRLVSKENLSKFDKILYALLKKLATYLGVNVENKNEKSEKNNNLLYDIIKNKKIFTAINCGMSNILNNTNNLVGITKEEYIEYLEKGKMVYERDNSELYLNFFDENIKYFKIVDRLLSKTESNLLLIGSNSLGRKKSLKLISTSLHYDIISPNFTKDYSIKDFKKVLKDLYQVSGVEGRGVVFLIEEHHLIKKEILELINSLLCSGEVPGLLTNEEIEGFLCNIVNEYKEQNEFKNLYEFFLSRIKRNLKIIIVLDYDNKEFNNLISNNPALISKCSIVWYQDFTRETMEALSKELLKDYAEKLNSNIKKDEGKASNKRSSSKNTIFDLIIKILIEIFSSISKLEENENEKNNQHSKSTEKIISTHGKFIELILNFKAIFYQKISSSSSTKDHLKSGLNKLIEAEKFVEQLTVKSKQQNIEIQMKTEEANSSLDKITSAMSLAANKRIQLEQLSKVIMEDSKIVEENKAKVEAELKDVLPEVEKAKQLVKKLDSSKLTELRAYFRQPILKPEVYLVLKAMLQLIGYSDLTSEGVKSTFGAETISTLANFEIKKLTKENFRKVLNIINDNPSYFDRNNVQRINYALAQIAEYVNAVVKFFKAKENIKPLEQALEEAEEKLGQSQKNLNSNAKDLDKIDKQIAEFRENFEKKTAEALTLKNEYLKTEELINKARNLLQKLSNEKSRWEIQQNDLIVQSQMLPFNSCISASFVTFLGYYNESIREKFTKLWKEILKENINLNKNIFSSEVNLESSISNIYKFMINESEALKFKSQGLPFDNLSLENAITIQNTTRTSLIIDPNSKAIEWFKKFIQEKNQNQAFEVISMQDPKLLTSIELAIRFGKMLLIDDVDYIDPFLVPIIRKESFKQGPRSVMKLGDKIVDIHDNFKFYLSTRNPFIEISSNIFSSLTVVNFTVTKSGLESLLLGLTIDIEKPELERKKNEILELQDKIKLELAEVEKKLLEELIHLEGNLLENKELIASLEQSKEKSIKSEESLKHSLELSEEIDMKRDIYKPLSKLATVIYMLLQDINKINPMYRFSLDDFVGLYRKTLKTGQNKHASNEKNLIKFFIDDVIKESYFYFTRSIFKNDLILFSMFFVKSIFYDNDILEESSYEGKSFLILL